MLCPYEKGGTFLGEGQTLPYILRTLKIHSLGTL